ncbi:MAG: hypothetical protein K8S55_02080 [Phycisphaerae bacterium]|nr:hypothetical protein [Phycisphaerae bacterium]
MKLYRPKNMWLNDPKVFYEEGKYHLFHLQGPKAQTWEEICKQREAYGHAVSDDGISWKTVKPIIKPGKKGSWDDSGTWTGDIVKKDGTYYLLYTGVCYQDTIMRMGLATSKDLINWEKHPDNPVSEPDPQYYLSNVVPGYSHVRWGDATFLYDEKSGWVYAYLTAQLPNKVWNKMGCIGLVRSKDMIHWEAMPPVYSPGKEVYHEVPQVIKVKGKYLLFFGTKVDTGGFGNPASVRCVISDSPFHFPEKAETTRFIGGQPRAEYTTCVYKRNNKYELIHLTYEGTDKDFRGYIRGRVSLPKRLCFRKDLTPYVQIREDLKPGKKENVRFFQKAFAGKAKADSIPCKMEKGKVICVADGETRRLVLGEISGCSLRLRIKRKGDAQVGILGGLGKRFAQGKQVKVSGRNHLEVIDLKSGQTLDYGKVATKNNGEYEMILIFIGEHIEIYVNDVYIGTTFSLKEHKFLGLEISGKGVVTISDFGMKNIV